MAKTDKDYLKEVEEHGQVASRAVGELIARGLVARAGEQRGKGVSAVRLTERGRAVLTA